MTLDSLEVPAVQRAAVFDELGGPITVREIPVPVPSHEEILVRIRYSGVCHSDLHIYKGETPLPVATPLVGGHEGVGTVVKVGGGVTNFKVGDTVGLKWINGTCLSCEHCKRGHEPNCVAATYSGFGRDGTFQQYALGKASEAAKIPDGIELSKAAPILCAVCFNTQRTTVQGVTVYRGLKETNVKAGQIVAITGAGGGLGSLAIQYAKAMGFRVLAIDVGAAKEKHCRSLGAEFFVDAIASPNVVAEILELTGGGAHGVLNLATAEKPIEDSLSYVRIRGTVVLVSLPKNAKITADIFWTVFRTITIKGSYVGTRQDADEALDFLRRGLVDVPVEVHPLEAIPALYERLEKGQINGRAVVDLWK